MKHLNRLCKDAIKGLGANKTPEAITRIGNAMGPLYHRCTAGFDNSVLYAAPSQRHNIASSEKDRNKIIPQVRAVQKEHKNISRKFPKLSKHL